MGHAINLFKKPKLNNFILPPYGIVLKNVQLSGRLFDKGGLERRAFLPDSHTILINLFSKPGLKNFLQPPYSIVLKSVRLSGKFFDEGGLEKCTFLPHNC